MSELDCVRVREVAAELALGILAGEERAAAVAHLDRCPECREYVEQLTLVGDGLLDLLPASEPPPGFETRVTAAIRADRRARHPAVSRRPGGRTRSEGWRTAPRFRLAAAAAVIALVAGLGGWAIGAATGHSATSARPTPAPSQPAQPLLRATLVADRHEVGTVWAHPGTTGWVYMEVDLGHEVKGVDCELVHRDGSTHDVGWFA